MSEVFWLVTIIMVVLAFAFVAMPLIKAQRQKLLVALGIAVPVVAVSIYLLLGSPGTPSGPSAVNSGAMTTAPVPTSREGDKVGSVSSMIDGLAQRLEENPDDGKGWMLLARSYQHLNRHDDAAYAYSKAKGLGEFDETFEKQAVPTATSAAQIYGNLSLSADAAAIAKPDDTVFIFARGVDDVGAPAAVFQRPVSDLPLDFLLNDSQSMVPGVKLSDFSEVVVTARISRSGNAMEALQGLEAKSDPITIADNKHLSLVID